MKHANGIKAVTATRRICKQRDGREQKPKGFEQKSCTYHFVAWGSLDPVGKDRHDLLNLLGLTSDC